MFKVKLFFFLLLAIETKTLAEHSFGFKNLVLDKQFLQVVAIIVIAAALGDIMKCHLVDMG